MIEPDAPDPADPKAGRDEASGAGKTAPASGRAAPGSERPAEPARPAPPAPDQDARPESPVPPETDQPVEPVPDQNAGTVSSAPPETEERAEEGKDAPGEEDAAAKDKQQGRYVLQVRFGALPVTGTATATRADIFKGGQCIVRTSRGMELGLALIDATEVEGQVGETVGHVLRPASARDLERQSKIEDELEPDEFRYCREKIRERSLRMRLSAVEHIWGGERVVFYFTAERRVDFRALVRDLAWHYHARIELRQIGARDEARLMADFEHCGRPLCCRTFLRDLSPVTMRMAKLQRTTLDPSKISGRCGRLMCCLRYEDATYRELRRGLPNRGTRVSVGQTEGEVISTDILAQRISVRLGDGQTVTVPVGDLRPPPAQESSRTEGDPGRARGPRRSGGPSRRGRRKGGQK